MEGRSRLDLRSSKRTKDEKYRAHPGNGNKPRGSVGVEGKEWRHTTERP